MAASNSIPASVPRSSDENGTPAAECPRCGHEYERIGHHWSTGRCPRPDLTDRQHEILTGILLGDGNVSKPGRNPYFRVGMVNPVFLHWLDGELGIQSTGVKFDRTADQQADHAERQDGCEGYACARENFRDFYTLATRTHPELKAYWSWYRSGEKRYPDHLELTPLVVKMWYCCDGAIGWDHRSTIQPVIHCNNEADRQDELLALFDDTPFSPSFYSGGIYFGVEEGRQLLDWMGDAPPGFEYKWEADDYDEYQRLKNSVVTRMGEAL